MLPVTYACEERLKPILAIFEDISSEQQVFNRYSAFNTSSKFSMAQSPMAINRATNLPSVHCRRRMPSAM
ncbi:Roundabout 1 [Manis pentadactyla]|nr:Roundabout 1 [Manis pentadactyla]